MDNLKKYADILEQIEHVRAQKLYDLNKRRTEGKISQLGFDKERKAIHEAADELKEQTQKEYSIYRDEYRKALALSLNAPEDDTPEAKARWRKAIEKVQNAKTHEEINELVREASRWKDADLARALTYAHAGTRDKEYIHASLLGQDAVVDELYNFEKLHAGYRAPQQTAPESSSWSGWTTPSQVVGADGVPGRLRSLNPKQRKQDEEEQRRQQEER